MRKNSIEFFHTPLQEAIRHGVIYLNASVLGKQYTVVFVNGVMMTRCLTYSML